MATHGVDVEAIRSVREAHVAALNAGQADAWASLFTDNGVQMPPNAPANAGRDRIRSWSRAFLDMFRAAFALAVEEIRTGGDWAFERGAYRIRLTPAAGGRAPAGRREVRHDLSAAARRSVAERPRHLEHGPVAAGPAVVRIA